MRRVRFRDSAGNVRGGRWTTKDGETVVTAASGPYGRIAFGDETFDPDEVEILAPCEPTKLVCVGRNYADHAAERDSEIPERPLLFLKPPNAVADPGSAVELPAGKARVDHEAEIAFVMSDQARNVDAADAMEYVAGFTCLDDVSNRDDQDREQNWVRGKAFDASAPIGPCVADPEDVPADAAVELRVNGGTRQASSREEFIFSVGDLVEEVTTYMTLEPGDVVSTGTPAGVAPLADGDRVEVAVEGVGVLEHGVSAE